MRAALEQRAARLPGNPRSRTVTIADCLIEEDLPNGPNRSIVAIYQSRRHLIVLLDSEVKAMGYDIALYERVLQVKARVAAGLVL